MLSPIRSEIRKRRNSMNISQRSLGKKAILPNNAISRIENGNSSYTYPIRAKAIANALGCNVSDIFQEVKRK